MISSRQLSAGQIAKMSCGKLVGNDNVTVTGVESLAESEPRHVSFLGNPKYNNLVASTNAGVVLLPRDFSGNPASPDKAWVLCDNPSAAFSKIIEFFAPPPPPPFPGVHPVAVVDAKAKVAASASVGPCAVIEPGAIIGERSVIGAGCYIGHETSVGDDSLIYPNVTIRERCIVGNRVIIHSGTTIGSDGFGFIPGANGHVKIPQVGIVQIDDDVEIGAQVAVDRARFGRTWIKRGAKIDNLVQIAHNVVVGEHSFLVAQCGIAGSSRLGHHVIIAGQAGVAGHITMGDGSVLLGQSGVNKDVEPGKKMFGILAVEQREYVRRQMYIDQIPELKRQIKELQEQLHDRGNSN